MHGSHGLRWLKVCFWLDFLCFLLHFYCVCISLPLRRMSFVMPTPAHFHFPTLPLWRASVTTEAVEVKLISGWLSAFLGAHNLSDCNIWEKQEQEVSYKGRAENRQVLWKIVAWGRSVFLACRTPSSWAHAPPASVCWVFTLLSRALGLLDFSHKS